MGFSINDTIVVFDRVRENFRSMRAEPLEIMNTSINQTLSRTIITSVVAFLTVLSLYLYGGGSLAGMSEAMMIGIVIGTASSILVACPLLTIGALKVSKQDPPPGRARRRWRVVPDRRDAGCAAAAAFWCRAPPGAVAQSQSKTEG